MNPLFRLMPGMYARSIIFNYWNGPEKNMFLFTSSPVIENRKSRFKSEIKYKTYVASARTNLKYKLLIVKVAISVVM